MTRLKICCIKSIEEARLASSYGPDAIGLVGPMPSGPGTIDPASAGEIVKTVPDHISTFYLTSKVTFGDIKSEFELVRSSHIQLTDHTEEQTRKDLKSSYPNVKLVQVVHVQSEESIQKAINYSIFSDFLLLDSGAPHSSVKELGGTGRTHNWEVSKAIVDSISIPVFLAGGIKTENLRNAIESVNPYGIDLCSGVRINDELDHQKLKLFFDEFQKLS